MKFKFTLLFCVIGFFAFRTHAQILISDVSPDSVCAGASVKLVFTRIAPLPIAVDTVQLSNSAGSFASGVVNLGTDSASIGTDSIAVTIPAGTVPGTGYRIRILSNPLNLPSNTLPLVVFSAMPVGVPVFTLGPVSNRCQGGASVLYSAMVSNPLNVSYTLSPVSAGTINPATGDVTYSSAFSGNDTITATALGCGGPTVAFHVVTVNPTPTVTTTSPASPICSGTTFNTTLTASTPSTFSRSIVQSNVTGGTAGATAVINDVLVNTGNMNPGSIVYTVSPTSAAGCPGPSSNITVNVNPAPAVTNTSPASPICSGATFNTMLTASTPSTFSRSIAATGVTGGSAGPGALINDVLVNTSNSTLGSIVYSVTPTSAAGCPGLPANITVNVNPAPALTTVSPTSPICSGATFNTTLNATTPSTFSRTLFNTGITGGSAGAGALINDVLTSTSNSDTNIIVYIITPTSVAGCAGTTSNLTVIVNPRPSLSTASPASPICSGTTFNTTLTATAPSTFNRTIVPTGVTGGTTGAGTVINDLLVNTSNSTPGSIVYNVTPTSVPGCVGLPAAITVNVNPTPVLTSTSPAAPICSGTLFNTTLTATTSSSFNRTLFNTGVTGGTGGPGSVINDVLVSTSSSDTNIMVYTVTPTSVAGCPGAPADIRVIVNPAPTLTTASPAAPICSGTLFNTTLTATTPSTFNRVVFHTGITGGTAGAGSVINDVLISTSNSDTNSIIYRVTPSSSLGCAGVATDIKVIVNPAPAVTTISPASPICSGALFSTTLTASTPSTFGRSIFHTGITGGTGGPGSLINDILVSLSNSDTNTIVYTVTPTSALGCIGAPSDIRVIVNPAPALTTPVMPPPICSGALFNTTLTASTPSTFSRVIFNTGITGGTAGPGSLINDVLTSISNSDTNSITYRVTTTSNQGCGGGVTDLKVVVNPGPRLQGSLTSSICSGFAPLFPLLSTVGNSSTAFKWKLQSFPGLTINGRDSSNTETIDSPRFVNNSNALAANAKYSVLLTSNSTGCTNYNKDTVTIVVNPTPVLTSANDTTVCTNTFLLIPLQASAPSGFSFTAFSTSVVPVTSVTPSGTGSPITQNFVYNGAAQGSVDIRIIPTSLAGCVGKADTITVFVNPRPTTILPASYDSVICSGDTLNIVLSSNVTSTYTWSVTGNPSGVQVDPSPFNNPSPNNPAIRDSLYFLPGATAAGFLTYTVIPTSTATVTCQGPPRTFGIQVNPRPVVTNLPGLDSTCHGITYTRTLSANTTGTNTFTWVPVLAGPAVSGQSSSIIPVAVFQQTLFNSGNAAPDFISYRITPISTISPFSPKQCTGTPDTLELRVDPRPVLTTGTSRTICSDSVLVYRVGASTGAGSTFTWSRSASGPLPAIALSPQTSVNDSLINPLSTQNLLTPTTVVYTISLKSMQGCISAPAPQLSVTVNPTPSAPGIGIVPNTKICSGATALNFSAARAPFATEHFIWSTSPSGSAYQNPSIPNSHNTLISFPLPGTVAVSVYSFVTGFTCRSVVSTTSVEVNSSNNSANPSVVLFDQGFVTLSSNTISGYQWGRDNKTTLDSQIIVGETAQTFLFPTGGTIDTANFFYWVLATFQDGCVRKAYFRSPPSLGTGPGSVIRELPVKIYPNPAGAEITVEIPGSVNDVEIEVYDISGRRLHRQRADGHKTSLNTSGLAPGYYLLYCVRNGIRVATNRFIKN